MRVLVVTNHFFPENFRCNDLAFELQKRGHDVTVLTAIPDYPDGHYFKGYGLFKKRIERINGVKVVRAFVIPRGKGGGLRLMLNYASVFISQSIDSIFMALTNQYDVVVVHETSPVTVGIPAVFAKRIKRIPLYFWVLDLWPESLKDAGGVSNKTILNIFSNITKWIYKHSDIILISSKGFRQSICEKGDFKDKIVYFPNWTDSDLMTEKTYTLPAFPEGFRIMFAGNIGEAQDFEHIMKCALLLHEHKDIHFLIVGDGRKRQWVDSFVKENNLTDTVHLVGRHPAYAMPLFFKEADAMLVTLKDSEIFNLTLPAKVQAYMNSGKPIVAMLNGEGQRIIDESGCGIYCPASDSQGLADCILKMKETDSDVLKEMGCRGKDYADKYFNLLKCINHLEEIIKDK